MKTEKEFNHNADTVSEALGFDDKRFKELLKESLEAFSTSESVSEFLEKLSNSKMSRIELALSCFNIGSYYMQALITESQD